MAIVLFAVNILSLVMVILIQARWKQEKAELTQRIEYLNDNLTEENRANLTVTQSFNFRGAFNSATPTVVYNDQNMKNPSYRRAIKNYEEGKRSAKIATSIFVVIFLIVGILLFILYPSFVIGLFKNNATI